MHNYGRGIGFQDLSVSHLNADAFVTIKTWTVDTYNLARKQPANCQRVRSSLPIPFLVSVHGNLVWSRYKGKGRNGCHPVCIGIQSYSPGAGFREVVNRLTPFLSGAPQVDCQFGVVREKSCLHQLTHYELVGFIQGLSICHGTPLNFNYR